MIRFLFDDGEVAMDFMTEEGPPWMEHREGTIVAYTDLKYSGLYCTHDEECADFGMSLTHGSPILEEGAWCEMECDKCRRRYVFTDQDGYREWKTPEELELYHKIKSDDGKYEMYWRMNNIDRLKKAVEKPAKQKRCKCRAPRHLCKCAGGKK